MSDKTCPSDSIKNPALTDPNLSDSEVVELLVKDFPASVRVLIGADFRKIVTFAIARERRRAASVATQFSAHMQGKSIGAAQRGDVVTSTAMAEAARCLIACGRLIKNVPGGCGRCGGARVVPGAVRGLQGEAVSVPCPSCGDDPGSEASAATVSPIVGSDPSAA